MYARLTDFDRLHEVIDGIDRVELAGPGRLRIASSGGRAHRATVVENVVDRRLAWAPEGGEPGVALAFTIDAVAADACRVTLALTGLADDEAAAAQVRAERTLAALRRDLEGA